MSQKILVVVDMQNDFVDGSLGTKEAESIVEPAVKKAKTFDGTVIFTLDTHKEDYLSTQEGELLPVEHCIKGTEGWKLIGPMEEIREKREAKVFEKPTFGSVNLAGYLQELNEKEGIESIELIGLCTDVCVASNAVMLRAFLPETPIYVDASCCAGVTPESHKSALATLTSCQVRVINQE